MRRLTGKIFRLLALLALAGFTVAAQQPAPEPPESSRAESSQTGASQAETSATNSEQPQKQLRRQYSIWWPLVPDPLPPLQPPPPEKIYLESGTELYVILDTPLSTRMTKQGQDVTFLLSEPLDLGDGLELPPDTRVLGTVTEAKRPGLFARPGKLKVRIERIELPAGGAARLRAQLQSGDPSAVRLTADNNRATDLYNLASWGLQGTLVGASIGGGKGAAIGAGAGAAAALILMASRRGPDLYLEPGMPFIITLEEPVELRGWDVKLAQDQYANAHNRSANHSDASASSPDGDRLGGTYRPKLKRRPRNP